MSKIITCLIAIFLFSGCSIFKRSDQTGISGIYSTDPLPADIGSPYRKYLKFTKDGKVISLDSTLPCDSVADLFKNAKLNTTYSLDKRGVLSFTFNAVNVSKMKYTAAYSGKYDKKLLELEESVIYENDQSSINKQARIYKFCLSID